MIVNCHPIKNPKTRQECVPRGGSAFVNEVDGNLTLWRPDEDQPQLIELSWVRKFRGPTFDPMFFTLRQVETKTVKDAKGRPVRSVLAEAMSQQEMRAEQWAENDDLVGLLTTMQQNPGTHSPTALAKACGWLSNVGTETDAIKDQARNRTNRRLRKLKSQKLVENVVGVWRLTKAGHDEALKLTGKPRDDAA